MSAHAHARSARHTVRKAGNMGQDRTPLPTIPMLPLAMIDFEASSLSLSRWPEISSYPIEVGLAIAGVDGTIGGWSTLIRPDARWRRAGEWDRRSERVHGLSREQLDNGSPPHMVAAELNARLVDHPIVWSDEARYDGHWSEVLFGTADIAPTFVLRDLSAIWAADPDARLRYDFAREQRQRQHRAAADAADICTALVWALGQAG